MSDRPPARAGVLIVVSAPSGAGKTSLVRSLIERCPGIDVSISHTTREKRPAETAGVDYHFVSATEFRSMIDAGAFVEHAEVFGNYYGTAKANLLTRLGAGRDVVLEIDWQGARQVRERLAGEVETLISVFILPPSLEALTERLAARAQDDARVIERRLAQAVADMSHHHEFDSVVVNDDFDAAVAELSALVEAARSGSPRRQSAPSELVAQLLASG